MEPITIQALIALVIGIGGAIAALVKWLDLRSAGLLTVATADLQKQISDLRERIAHLESGCYESRKHIRAATKLALAHDMDDIAAILYQAEDCLR